MMIHSEIAMTSILHKDQPLMQFCPSLETNLIGLEPMSDHGMLPLQTDSQTVISGLLDLVRVLLNSTQKLKLKS